MKDKIVEITNKLNIIINTNNYNIPLLDNFEIIKQDIKSNIIFSAKYNTTTESFLCDGLLQENENFIDRINSIVKKTSDYLTKNKCTSYHVYYKDYNVNGFNFKIILQDIYINRNNQILTVKNINTYFVDKNKYVYLLSLASGPYLFNDSKQLKNIKSIKEDVVYSSLEKGMYLILDNIKYNENV